jgi:hypothetical protein
MFSSFASRETFVGFRDDFLLRNSVIYPVYLHLSARVYRN